MIEFDVCGPLPTGVTVLEASAGTGKTFTIAALAARYVAAGVPLSELLLVTFTRMATGELRERVRERLVGAERALSGPLPADADEVVRLLADGTRDEVAARRERLTRALADFDAATIATTHGFCQEILGGLGVAGDLDRDTVLVEDPRDLVEEVVDDLYVRRFAPESAAPPFDRNEALAIALTAVENPYAAIDPPVTQEQSDPAMRRRFAAAVRDEFAARKRRAGVMTYDDLLIRLEATLSPEVAAGLRARYRVVLVDEFQDTDPVQWEIMRRAFAAPGGTLVLIGDPKQAIYAFRGADVYAYLRAAASAGARATLQTNWRSDQRLLDAYDAVFGNAALGHPGIVYRRMRAARPDRAPAALAAPLRLRVVHRDDPRVTLTQSGYAAAQATREYIAADLAADVVRLLRTEAVRPGGVAVLVRANRTAALIRDALALAGVPAVINGAGSVFATLPADEWLRLLEAIERPASTLRARSAALTRFIGWSAERVACAPDEAWEGVHRRLHEWGRVLRTRGVAALAETLTLVEGLPEHVLRTPTGERDLTDLRHVGQLLHAAATAQQFGTAALTLWLRRRIDEASSETGDEERSRRLESDAEAVQVLTIHRSKGLEFPVVYCPDLWEEKWTPPDAAEPVAFHAAEAGDERRIDVGLAGPEYLAHKRQALIERRGEDLRLAYVALTRARHQAVVWWAGSSSSRHSALGRLLFARDAAGVVAWGGKSTPADAKVIERFEALAADAPGCVSVERCDPGLPAALERTAGEPLSLAAARWERELDWGWRRTSYSDLTAWAHEARVASEPEEAVVTDEPAQEPAAAGPVPAATPPPADPLLAVRSRLADMPGGVDVGTFVHRVLEATDFAAADLDAELHARVAEVRAGRGFDLGDTAAAVAGLRAALETPLVDGLRLCDVARADRLDELVFELPLAGGDVPAGAFEPEAIGALLRAHLPPGDPLAGYADRLGDPELRRGVRGYLTGSIDLVVRAGDAFYVVDYKTNRLAPPDQDLTAWHYRPQALRAEMERSHYGLQALLYTAALHRYLRGRLPGYDPGRQLAGVLYLFVRGMSGADTPAGCGVFAWRPPGALVEALSEALG